METTVKTTQEEVFFEVILTADTLARVFLSYIPVPKPKESKKTKKPKASDKPEAAEETEASEEPEALEETDDGSKSKKKKKKRKTEKPEKPDEENRVYAERKAMILDAIKSNKEDFSDAKIIVSKLSSVMDYITYYMTTDTTDFVTVHKKVKELNSILHIGRSYPNDAIKRAKKIREAWRGY